MKDFIRICPVLALLSICACTDRRGGSSGGEDGDTTATGRLLTVEQLLFHDSIGVVNTWCTQGITVDYPLDTCSSRLADSVRAWIDETLANTYFPQWGDESIIHPKRFDGDLREGRASIDFYGCQGVENLAEMLRPTAGEGMDMPYENEVALYLTSSGHSLPFTTYSGHNYVFLGGAHGSTAAISQTFRNSDGRRMGWNLLDMSKKDKILKLITRGIAEYFNYGSEDGQITEKNVMEYLLLWDDPDTPDDESAGLPLPALQPFVTADTLHFVYQQYEIAAYAAGMPTASIPVKDMKDCLSQEGRELLLGR